MIKPKRNFKIILNIYLLVSQLTMLILEMLPNAILISFSDGPNKWIVSSFSYFSHIPIGYADFSPIVTVTLTILCIGFCVAKLVIKREAAWLMKGILLCNTFIFLLSFSPIFRYGIDYMSVQNFCIAILSFVSIILLFFAKSKKAS